MKGIILAALLFAVPDPELRTPDDVQTRFVEAVRACGREPPFMPALVSRTTRAMIFYDAETRAVYYPAWAELPEETQAALNAAAAPGVGGEARFTDLFTRLLIAHELGHWLETIHDRHIDHWASELQANRIMLAFWRLQMANDEAVLRRFEPIWLENPSKPSPVPADQSIVDWFNTAPFDPRTYGWYQARMTEEAWRRRDEADFCALVDEAWPLV